MAFVAKLGALFFVLELQTTYAIKLQLLGGIWICQTVPSVLLALYVRLNPRALLAGWATGVGLGTWMEWRWASRARPIRCTSRAGRCPATRRSARWLANLAVSVVLTWC